MKFNVKTASAILLAIMCILSLSSCSKKNNAAANSNSNSTASRRGSFSQNVPDLYGEVKSISGNTVTLALLEIPQGRQANTNGGQNRPSGSWSRGNNGNNSQQGSGSNNSQNQQSGSTNSNNSGQGRDFNMTKNYTGKTETLTIPSDTSITAFQRSSNGSRSEKQLSISDIKVGSLLQVWYKKNTGSSKEIQSIRVVSITQSSQSQQQ